MIPLAVYTIPEVSMAGPTEEDCKEKNIPYLVGRAYYNNNPRGLIIGDKNGMLKMIFSPSDKSLLGVHILGELASELIHIGRMYWKRKVRSTALSGLSITFQPSPTCTNMPPTMG